MKRPSDLLLAIDDSPESIKAVEYASTWAGPMKGINVHLLHMLPPLPPELLEFGGSEDPTEEEKMDDQTHQKQRAWIQEQETKAAPMFERTREILHEHGVHEKSIHTHCCTSATKEEMIPAILETARAQQCKTIAVGRHTFHGLHKLLGHHVSDQLIRSSHDLTIWVVE